jgi:hypothetical protein
MVPHSLHNDGEEPVRAVDLFLSSTVESVFDRQMLPINPRVIGSPLEANQVLATGNA